MRGSAAAGAGAVAIRVVIADDHPIYRSGLAGVLADADDIDVGVGEGDDERDGVVGRRVGVDEERTAGHTSGDHRSRTRLRLRWRSPLRAVGVV